MIKKYKMVKNDFEFYKSKEEIKDEIKKLFESRGTPIDSKKELEKLTNIYIYFVDDNIELDILGN